MVDVVTVVGPPLAAEAFRAGRAFLLKITDLLQVVVHPGTFAAFGVGAEGKESQYFRLAMPMYIGNLSEYERCILRKFRCIAVEISTLGREKNKRLTLIGSHLVESLDFVQEEARLAAACLRDPTPESLESLTQFRWRGRKILESVVIESGKLERFVVEFRCPVGRNPPASIDGSWKFHLFSEVVFSKAATEAAVELAAVRAETNVTLGANIVELRSLGEDADGNWQVAQSLADSLRSG